MKNEAKPLRMSLGMGRSIQIQPTLKPSPVEAAYRTAIRRMFIAAGRTPAPWNVSIERQEQAIKELALTAPGIVSRGIEKLAERSAKAWERGNNSGDPSYDASCNETANLWSDVICRLCQLFDISADWNNGVPSFTVKGHCYHDALSAIRASVQNE